MFLRGFRFMSLRKQWTILGHFLQAYSQRCNLTTDFYNSEAHCCVYTYLSVRLNLLFGEIRMCRDLHSITDYFCRQGIELNMWTFVGYIRMLCIMPTFQITECLFRAITFTDMDFFHSMLATGIWPWFWVSSAKVLLYWRIFVPCYNRRLKWDSVRLFAWFFFLRYIKELSETYPPVPHSFDEITLRFRGASK